VHGKFVRQGNVEQGITMNAGIASLEASDIQMARTYLMSHFCAVIFCIFIRATEIDFRGSHVYHAHDVWCSPRVKCLTNP